MERFERPRIPVVITGLADGWPAGEAWTPESLRATCGEHRFKVGIAYNQVSAVGSPFLGWLSGGIV